MASVVSSKGVRVCIHLNPQRSEERELLEILQQEPPNAARSALLKSLAIRGMQLKQVGELSEALKVAASFPTLIDLLHQVLGRFSALFDGGAAVPTPPEPVSVAKRHNPPMSDFLGS